MSRLLCLIGFVMISMMILVLKYITIMKVDGSIMGVVYEIYCNETKNVFVNAFSVLNVYGCDNIAVIFGIHNNSTTQLCSLETQKNGLILMPINMHDRNGDKIMKNDIMHNNKLMHYECDIEYHNKLYSIKYTVINTHIAYLHRITVNQHNPTNINDNNIYRRILTDNIESEEELALNDIASKFNSGIKRESVKMTACIILSIVTSHLHCGTGLLYCFGKSSALILKDKSEEVIANLIKRKLMTTELYKSFDESFKDIIGIKSEELIHFRGRTAAKIIITKFLRIFGMENNELAINIISGAMIGLERFKKDYGLSVFANIIGEIAGTQVNQYIQNKHNYSISDFAIIEDHIQHAKNNSLCSIDEETVLNEAAFTRYDITADNMDDVVFVDTKTMHLVEQALQSESWAVFDSI